MAGGSDSDGTGGGRRRRNRPSTTIDLTATEVRRAEAAAAAAAAAPSADAAEPSPPDEPIFADETPPAAAARPDETPEGNVTAAGAEAMAAGTEADRPAGGPDPDVAPETAAAAEAEAQTVADPAGSGTAAEPTRTPDAGADEPEPSGATARDMAEADRGRERRGSALGALAAAAIGGLVVLAGGAALLATGALPLGGTDVATRADLTAVEERLADLSGRVETPPAPDAALAERVAALEQAATAAPPAGSAADADLAGIRDRIAALEAAPPPADAGAAVDLGPLTASVDALEADLSALRGAVEAAPGADLDARVSELADRLAALEGAITEIGDAVSGLRADIAASGQTVEGLTAASSEAAGRLQAIEERLDAGPKGGEIAALSLAVTTLATKVAAGEPFAADLAVVREAAPDVPGIDALAASAETGAPTVEDLARSLPVADILATRTPDGNAGVVDRLFAGAKSLVNYRETGAAATDPTAAALSGIETALAAGDLPAARAAAGGLPAPAQEAAAGWIADLDRRIAADEAVAALTDRILTRLQAPAEGQ